MATDAEINLKVNIPPPKGPDIEKMLADIKRLGRFTTDYLKESAKGADIAEAAKIGRERAAKVGEEVAKNWEKGFADGFKNVATMGRSHKRIGLANEAVAQDVAKAEEAWRSGKLSDDKMVAILGKKSEQQNAVYEASGNLKNMVGGALSDLTNLGQMEELLTKHEKFSEAIRGEAEGARALALELRNSAGALEDEAEALDVSIPGNEKRKLQLLQQAKDDRARANAAEKAAEVIEAETVAINKNIAAVDGSADSYEKANKAIDRSTTKALDQKKKLVELGAKQAISDQKQVVQEQQLAEQQERRAAAEAKRAKQEELIRERTLYQDSLIGKKKLELAKIASDLNKQLKAAVSEGDAETIARLKMQYSAVRSAMRAASMQANVTRMMFMQQAQTASRLSGNITTLAQGFADLANYTKNGTVNITGMASSLLDLWFAMKAGMGPVGWLMMGLQGVQMLLNKHGEATKKAREEEKKHQEQMQALALEYVKISNAQRTFNREKRRNEQLETIRSQYEDIEKEIKKNKEAIDLTYNAEERRLALLDREEKTRSKIAKKLLSTKLAAGEISQYEYNKALLSIDKKEGELAINARTESAALSTEKALEVWNEAKHEKEKAEDKLKEEENKLDEFTVPQDQLQTLRGIEEGLEKKVYELELHEAAVAKKIQAWLQNKSPNILGKYNGDWNTARKNIPFAPFDTSQYSLNALNQELDSTREKLEKKQAELKEAEEKRKMMLNGMSVDEYEDEYARQKTATTEARSLFDALKNEVETTRKSYDDAARQQREILKENESLREEQNKLHQAEIEALEAQRGIQQEAEARQKEIAELTKKLDEMTIEQLAKELSEAEISQAQFAKGSAGYNDYGRLIDAINGRLDNNPVEAKRRKKEIQKLREDIDDMSLIELRAARKKMRGKRNKYAEGTAAYGEYEAARAMFDERIKADEETRKDLKKDILLEARKDDKKKAVNAAFFTSDETGKTLFDKIMAVDDDGKLIKSEIDLLLKGLKQAQKLRNSEMESIIRAILREQANNEKNSNRTLKMLKRYE